MTFMLGSQMVFRNLGDNAATILLNHTQHTADEIAISIRKVSIIPRNERVEAKAAILARTEPRATENSAGDRMRTSRASAFELSGNCLP